MTVLDSAAALVRARAQIGQPDGAGMCLANVYKWFGSVQSIGPGAGRYDVALAGWNYSPEKLYPMVDAPAGVAVWYGISPTRWDKNKMAGDVGLSIGGGYGIFTDSLTGNTGVMAFSTRAAQIQRPPLGFTTDFLGHDTTAGLAWLGRNTPEAAPVVVIPPAVITRRDSDMPRKVISKETSNRYILWKEIVETIRKGENDELAKAISQADGTPFVEMSSKRIKLLLEQTDKRADLLSTRDAKIVKKSVQDALRAESA